MQQAYTVQVKSGIRRMPDSRSSGSFFGATGLVMSCVTVVSRSGYNWVGFGLSGGFVGVAVASEAVAGLLAAGGVKELGEAAGGALVAGVIDRGRNVFGADARSVDALERTRRNEPGAVAELASALAWYARRDQRFAEDLAAWAAHGGGAVVQQARAGRDAYVAGHDQTITNYRLPGE